MKYRDCIYSTSVRVENPPESAAQSCSNRRTLKTSPHFKGHFCGSMSSWQRQECTTDNAPPSLTEKVFRVCPTRKSSSGKAEIKAGSIACRKSNP